MTLLIGILLALACACTTNLAFLYKHRGACRAAPVDIRRPLRSARSLFASPWFSIGMLVALVGWGFHVAALAVAPMSIVQTVLAGGIVALAVMAERLFGLRVGRRQWLGLALAAAALALLGLTLPATAGSHARFSLNAMIAFEAGLLAIGALLIAGPRLRASAAPHHGVMLGAAAGILFGVSDVSIKALTGIVGDGLLGALLSPWAATAAIASVAGFYASARGLQDGEAVPVIAITGVAANIAGILGGIVVFGDPLPASTLGIVVQSFAFALVIGASALTPGPIRLRTT